MLRYRQARSSTLGSTDTRDSSQGKRYGKKARRGYRGPERTGRTGARRRGPLYAVLADDLRPCADSDHALDAGAGDRVAAPRDRSWRGGNGDGRRGFAGYRELAGTHHASVDDILQELLVHERKGVELYRKLLKVSEGWSVSLEEFAREKSAARKCIWRRLARCCAGAGTPRAALHE